MMNREVAARIKCEDRYFDGGVIMFGFDKIFDFNNDGQFHSLEKAVQFQFVDHMLHGETKLDSFSDDDEKDVFANAGLDYEELEFMDPEERREVLEDAGLDPNEFDF